MIFNFIRKKNYRHFDAFWHMRQSSSPRLWDVVAFSPFIGHSLVYCLRSQIRCNITKKKGWQFDQNRDGVVVTFGCHISLGSDGFVTLLIWWVRRSHFVCHSPSPFCAAGDLFRPIYWHILRFGHLPLFWPTREVATSHCQSGVSFLFQKCKLFDVKIYHYPNRFWSTQRTVNTFIWFMYRRHPGAPR